jgi:outer membrane protein
MKKLLAIGALALTVGYAQAQTTLGKMMIGGTVSYWTQKSESPMFDGEYTYTDFYFRPQAGYFVADRLAIGLALDINSHKREYPYTPINQINKNSEIVFAPFVRYYKFTTNEKFAFYAEASVGYGFTKTKADGGDDYNGNVFRTRLSPGFSYFFNEKWALDLELSGISYTSSNPNNDSDVDNDETTGFNFGISSLSPALGFRYFIGK